MGWIKDHLDDAVDWVQERRDDIREVGRDIEDEVRRVGRKIDNEIWEPFKDLFARPEFPTPNAGEPSYDVRINKTGNALFLPLVYGTRRVGGPVVFGGLSGDNQYLHLVVALCEGPVWPIYTVWLDDTEYSLIATEDDYRAEYDTDAVYIETFSGTTDQEVSATLAAAFAEWTAADHAGPGTAYVHVRIKYDTDGIASVPRINALVYGRMVTDFRIGDTAQSYDDAANPVLCLYDLLTNTRYGKGISTSGIDAAAFAAAADYCDTVIAPAVGVSIRRHACGAVIDTSQPVKNNIAILGTSCRARVYKAGGGWTIGIDRDVASTFSFDRDNIIGGLLISHGGKSARFNRVKALFTNPDKNWEQDVAVVESATYRAADNGEVLELELKLPATTNVYRALNEAELTLNKSRQQLGCSFLASPAALTVVPGDVVDVTHATPGWEGKLFRVNSVSLLMTGLVDVGLVEHEPNAYTATARDEARNQPDTTLPSPFTVDAPTGLQINSGDTHLVQSIATGEIFTRVRVTWTASTSIYVTGYIVEMKRSIDANYLPAFFVHGRLTEEVYLSGVADGVAYDFRIRAINTFGRSSEWVSALNHTIVGKTAPPPDVTTFSLAVQGDGTREFRFGIDNPPVDLWGYVIRYHATETAWDDMTALHTDVLTSSPWETNQLLAGSYNFACKAVDTSGNESVNARLLTDYELGNPRLGSLVYGTDPHLDGWPGTKTNCFLSTGASLEATDSATWNDRSTWDGWTQWNMSPAATITYEHTEIDIGADTLVVIGVAAGINSATAAITVDYKTAAGSYAGFGAIPGSAVTLRYLKVKVTGTKSGTAPPVLRSLPIRLYTG